VRQHPSPRTFATEVVTAPQAPEIAIDPVCGMEVVVTPDAISAEHAGTTSYFCCDGCRTRFLAEVGT
jgi:YHS domain-containing protein